MYVYVCILVRRNNYQSVLLTSLLFRVALIFRVVFSIVLPLSDSFCPYRCEKGKCSCFVEVPQTHSWYTSAAEAPERPMTSKPLQSETQKRLGAPLWELHPRGDSCFIVF